MAGAKKDGMPHSDARSDRQAVPLLALVSSLSKAMDCISSAVVDHHLRVAYFAAALAETLELDERVRGDLLLAGLLHDSGAFSLKSRIDALQFETDSAAHAEFGYRLLSPCQRLGLPALYVRSHHATRRIARRSEGEIPREATLLCLADRIDALIQRNVDVPEQAQMVVRRIVQSKELFFPEHLEAFLTRAQDKEFWEGARDPVKNLTRHAPVALRAETLDIAGLLEFTELFSQIIDFRSQFTATHSRGVAATAVLLATLLGFSEEDCGLLHVAGNLHDLGKLAVPSELLEKPGPLTEEEFATVKRHPQLSEEILSAAPGLERATAWASQHHERLDGKGYPFGLRGEQISLGSRIMAVADVFTALAEDRPYRAGMPQEEVARIMREMAKDGKLDGDVTETLLDYFEAMNETRSHAQAAARRTFDEFYRG